MDKKKKADQKYYEGWLEMQKIWNDLDLEEAEEKLSKNKNRSPKKLNHG